MEMMDRWVLFLRPILHCMLSHSNLNELEETGWKGKVLCKAGKCPYFQQEGKAGPAPLVKGDSHNPPASHPRPGDTPHSEKTTTKLFIKVRDHLGHSPVSMKGLCLSVTGHSITQGPPLPRPLVKLIPRSTIQLHWQARIH